MKFTRLFPFLALLFAGCDNESEPVQAEPELAPITFACQQTATRADATYISSTTMAGYVGVFGYRQGTDAWDASRFAPDLMFNQQMEVGADGKSLTYSPLHYWPNGDGQKLAFFAYYPYTENNVWQHGLMIDQDSIIRGKARIEFRQREQAKDQTDFMVSEWIKDQTRLMSTPLNFTFNHLLARVKVDISGYSDVTRITLKPVIMQQVYDCLNANWLAGTKKYGQAVIDMTSGDEAAHTLLLIPQSTEGITLTIEHSGGSNSIALSSGSWLAGKSYVITN